MLAPKLCVLDADGVAAGSSDPEAQLQQVCCAISCLQHKGLHVILISESWEDALSSSAFVELTAVKPECLLHVFPMTNDVGVNLVVVAEEYACPFITNRDIVGLMDHWKLPPRLQDWLKRARFVHHYRFSLGVDGMLQVIPAYGQELPWSPPPKQWLEDGESDSDIDVFCLESPSPQVLVQPTEDHRGTFQKSVNADANVKEDCCQDQIVVCVVLVNKPLLCIVCRNKSEWLFPCAHNLCSRLVGSDLDQDDTYDDELDAALARQIPNWVSCIVQMLTVSSGTYAGYAAVGLGPNVKTRRRASRLALAATVASQMCSVEDPFGDGEFPALVDRAKDLLTNTQSPRISTQQDPPILQRFMGSTHTGAQHFASAGRSGEGAKAPKPGKGTALNHLRAKLPSTQFSSVLPTAPSTPSMPSSAPATKSSPKQARESASRQCIDSATLEELRNTPHWQLAERVKDKQRSGYSWNLHWWSYCDSTKQVYNPYKHSPNSLISFLETLPARSQDPCPWPKEAKITEVSEESILKQQQVWKQAWEPSEAAESQSSQCDAAQHDESKLLQIMDALTGIWEDEFQGIYEVIKQSKKVLSVRTQKEAGAEISATTTIKLKRDEIVWATGLYKLDTDIVSISNLTGITWISEQRHKRVCRWSRHCETVST